MLKPIQFAKSAFQVVLSLIILTVVVTPSFTEAATPSPTPTQDPFTTKLVDLAQANLDAENNVLIAGDSTKLTKANLSLSGLASQGINTTASTQLRIHDGLALHGLHYTKISSKLTVENLTVSQANATVTAEENITSLIDNGSKSPVTSKEAKKHILHYTMQGGVWSLVQDETPDDIVRAVVEPGAPKITGKQLNVLGTSKTTSTNTAMTASIVHGTFNPSGAINYARSYWNNYNSAYRTYDNDCTNFVSQALNWGGWQHNGGQYDDPNYWWYSPSIILQWGGRAESRSWINTNYFYWFARYSGRAHDAQYLSDFRPGDVLQIDQSVPDGTLDHTEIVTTKDSSGNIYLTSHSVNVLDKPFWTIYYQYPGANFYGTIMNYSY